MTPEGKKNKRLVALFLFGFVLLNFPILSLVNLHIFVFGLPLQFIYIFGIWGLLILLSALVTMRSSRKETDHLE
jgi:pilus assembly protein TadC